MLVRHAVGGLVSCSVLALAGCAGAGTGSSTSVASGPGGGGGRASAPARDTFTGVIVSGQGAYSGDRGTVTIYLHPHGVGRARTVGVVLRGRCAGAPLRGSLSGSLTRSPGRIPDVGSHYLVLARGPVRPLGQVLARGVIQATGFIARGQELMSLTLSTASGSLVVRAHTGRVPGFRAP